MKWRDLFWPEDQSVVFRVTVYATLVAAAIVGIWTAITNSWNAIWSAMSAPSEVPTGFLLIIASVAVVALVRRMISLRQPEHVKLYRRDCVDGILWKWSYDRSHRIIEKVAYCPKDNVRIILRPESMTLPGTGAIVNRRTGIRCPICNYAGRGIAGTDKIADEEAFPKIEGWIDSGEWRDRVDRAREIQADAAANGLWQPPPPAPAPLLSSEDANEF